MSMDMIFFNLKIGNVMTLKRFVSIFKNFDIKTNYGYLIFKNKQK